MRLNILITYDVSTVTPQGRKRLRQVAKAREAFGQRVQSSQKTAVDDPHLKVPPASRGNRVGAPLAVPLAKRGEP